MIFLFFGKSKAKFFLFLLSIYFSLIFYSSFVEKNKNLSRNIKVRVENKIKSFVIKLNICVTFYSRDEEDKLRWRVRECLKVGKLQSKNDEGVWVGRAGKRARMSVDLLRATQESCTNSYRKGSLVQLRKQMKFLYKTSASWPATAAATLRYDQWWFHFTLSDDASRITVACFPLYLKPGAREGRGRGQKKNASNFKR